MSETSSNIETAAAAATDNPEAVTAAVQQSHATAAPADPVNQQLAQHSSLLGNLSSRVSDFEAFMQKLGPLVGTLEQVAAGTIPGAMAVIERVDALEGFAADLIGSLNTHFSSKLALPDAPKAAPAEPSKPA